MKQPHSSYANMAFQRADVAKNFLEVAIIQIGKRVIRVMPFNQPYNFDPESNLIIKNLEGHLNESDIIKKFREYGEILSCKLVRDDRGESKCYAYLQFKDRMSALSAIDNLNNTYWDEPRLKIPQVLGEALLGEAFGQAQRVRYGGDLTNSTTTTSTKWARKSTLAFTRRWMSTRKSNRTRRGNCRICIWKISGWTSAIEIFSTYSIPMGVLRTLKLGGSKSLTPIVNRGVWGRSSRKEAVVAMGWATAVVRALVRISTKRFKISRVVFFEAVSESEQEWKISFSFESSHNSFSPSTFANDVWSTTWSRLLNTSDWNEYRFF